MDQSSILTNNMPTSIPARMRAWRKHRNNSKPVWEEVAVPPTPRGGFLCRIIAAGVCRSDYSLLTNEDTRPWVQEKYTLGHEGCGQIVDIGEDAQNLGHKIGDVVALFAIQSCLSEDCIECSRDLPQLCKNGHHSGIGQEGFFTEYAAMDARAVVKLPPNVSPLVGAISTDAVTTAYHAVVKRARVQQSDCVFLFGLGGLGFNALQILRHIGCRIIVSDTRQDTMEAAKSLGIAEADCVPVGTTVRDFVKSSGLENKIDIVLDFVGMNQTFEDAQYIVRPAGKMVCIGTLDHENTINMKIGIRKRLTVLFSYGGQVQDLKEVLDLIAEGALNPQICEGRIEDFDKHLQDLCNGKIKGRIALVP